jgi:hypothetical protein
MCVARTCACVLAVKVFAIGRRFARAQAHRPQTWGYAYIYILSRSLLISFFYCLSYTQFYCVYVVYTYILLRTEERAQTRTRTCQLSLPWVCWKVCAFSFSPLPISFLLVIVPFQLVITPRYMSLISSVLLLFLMLRPIYALSFAFAYLT